MKHLLTWTGSLVVAPPSSLSFIANGSLGSRILRCDVVNGGGDGVVDRDSASLEYLGKQTEA